MLDTKLQKKPAESVAPLRVAQDAKRLQLAVTGAGIVAFNWTVADDVIVWDGARDILPHQIVSGKTNHGKTLLGLMSSEGRNKLSALFENRARETVSFEIDIELATAIGSVWFVMLGVRIPDADGATERSPA